MRFNHSAIWKLPIALAENVCKDSVDNLNHLLADTITPRDLYEKHHWQVAGPMFYQLHLLFDKHDEQQNELVDEIAERIPLLGGVSIAMAHDVAATTRAGAHVGATDLAGVWIAAASEPRPSSCRPIRC